MENTQIEEEKKPQEQKKAAPAKKDKPLDYA